MTINVSNIELVLNQKLSVTSETPYNMLVYAKTLEKLKTGTVSSVEFFSQLPSATANNLGELYFVEADKLLYFANTNFQWEKLTRDFSVTAYGWGLNDRTGLLTGQVGDNTVINRSSPVSVVGGYTDWCQVSAGGSHSAAVRTNGTIWTWGCNQNGSLGDGTAINSSSPVSVVGGFTDWCQVSAGHESHNFAIRTNRTLWTWGANGFGQLGDNTGGAGTNKSSPVSVVGNFTDWIRVSAGGYFSTAIRSNGTLWTWGRNDTGQLGQNTPTTTNISSPVSVVGGFTDWCQVSAGYNYAYAIRTNGTLWSWGYNVTGQLGDNTTVDKSSPVSVVGGFTDWCQVSGGNNSGNAAAIRTNGTLWAWGISSNGALGDNNSLINRSSPVSVVGGFTDWCQVSVGDIYMTAIRTNGTLWTWGNSSFGKLGDNNFPHRSSPVSVVGGFANWCQVSAKVDTTLALTFV